MHKTISVLIALLFFSLQGITQTNTFPSSGNVGIGATSPLSKLDINTVGTGGISLGAYNIPTTPGVMRFVGVTGVDGTFNAGSLTGVNNGAAGMVIINTADGWGNSQEVAFYSHLNGYQSNQKMVIKAGDNVGIGTTASRSNLEMVGGGWFSSSAGGSSLILQSSGLPTNVDYSNIRLIASSNRGSGFFQTHIDNWGGIFNWTRGSASGEVELMRLDATTGNVGIGNVNPQSKLAVNGDIFSFSKKIEFTQTGWPYYVFSSQYKLPTPTEVEAFIQQYNHLPGIPSAAKIENEGLDIGETQAALLKKTEELTLYIIELKKDSDRQEKRIETLSIQLSANQKTNR